MNTHTTQTGIQTQSNIAPFAQARFTQPDVLTFYAQPYDISATGFYFGSTDDYETKSEANRNEYGQPVEEYEFQIIDGTAEECALFNVCSVNQCNISEFIELVETLLNHDLAALYYLCSNHGMSMSEATDMLDDVTLYSGRMKDAAQEQFDEFHLHEIPVHLHNYIDYEAYQNDLQCGGDMVEFDFAGDTYTCTNSNSL